MADPGYWQSTLKTGVGSGWSYGGMSIGTRLIIVLVILMIFGGFGVFLENSLHDSTSYLKKPTTPTITNYNYPSGNTYRNVTPYYQTRSYSSPALSNTLKVYGVSPGSGTAGSTVSVEVTGTASQAGTTVWLYSDTGGTKIPGTGVMIYGVDRLACQFDLHNVVKATYILTVSTPDGQESSSSFKVQ
jgi:hypothetical protein